MSSLTVAFACPNETVFSGKWDKRHAHACTMVSMRTTVELKAEHRSALLALASRRGQKGFSEVLGEAIESFLEGEAERGRRRKTLLSLAGSLSKKEGDALRETAKALRENWR